jgi:hypothetical protein
MLSPSRDPDALAAAIEAVLAGLDAYNHADIAHRAAARWSFESVGGVWDEIYRSLSRR